MLIRAGMYFCWIMMLLNAPHGAEAAETSITDQARAELFAYRYTKAAELYQQATQASRSDGEAWYGLVRSRIGANQAPEAYAAGEQALKDAPGMAGAQAAAGLAMFRKGDFAKAEEYFHAGLRIDPGHAGSLSGNADIFDIVSKHKTARQFQLIASRRSPDDPDLARARAASLKGAEHLAALETLLPRLDPDSDEAKRLRAQIAADRAFAGLKLRDLASAPLPARINMFRVGPMGRAHGVGISVVLNGKHKVNLLLDTGASGIAITPKTAERAGLLVGGHEAVDAKGIGDKKPLPLYQYLAQELKIGSIIFRNYPVSVFRSAGSEDADGLIGPGVLGRFLVTLDFPALELQLNPLPHPADDPDEPVDAADNPAAGFHRAWFLGNHFGVTTLVNGKSRHFFLIDSGSSGSFIHAEVARTTTGVNADPFSVLRGVQGPVDNVWRADKVTLAFAGFQQENSNLLAMNLTRMSDDMGTALGGVLGMPVLWRMRLTIDYQQGTVRFEYK